MILFILRKRWIAFFSVSKNSLRLFTNGLWLLAVVFLAYTSGFVHDFCMKNPTKLSVPAIDDTLNYLLLLFPIILKFFPSISARNSLVYQHFPLKKWEAASLDILYTIFSTTRIFFLLLFTILFYSTSETVNRNEAFNTLLFGVTGIFLAENLLNGFYQNGKQQLFLTLGIIGGTIFSFQGLLHRSTSHSTTFSVAVMTIALLIYFSYYKGNELTLIQKKKSFLSLTKNIFVKVCIGTDKFTSAIAFSLFLQTIFTIVFFKYMEDDFSIAKYYMVSCATLFAYCYNNLWGFFRSLVFNMYISGSKMGDYVSTFIKLLLIPILLNLLIIFVIAVVFDDVLRCSFIFAIAVLSLFLIANGMLFSFMSVKNVFKGISIDRNSFNTSLVPTYIFGVLSLTLGYLEQYQNLFRIVLVLIFITSIGIIMYLFHKSKDFQHRLIERLTGVLIDKRNSF